MKITIQSNNKHLSASQVCRAVDCPASRFKKAEAAGLIVPDEILCNGRIKLYSADRLEALRSILNPVQEVA